MNNVNPQPPRLEACHLDEIRASIDWQTMFAALGLRKCEKKSKPDDWWAYSPFHDERTPSFHITHGGLWYDFSIGAGGGPIELVQRIEGGNCYEAGRLIVERGWSTASLESAKPVARIRQRTRARAAQTVAPACADDAPRNAPIRQDLFKMCVYHDAIAARGISEETCDLLGIGFLPQGRSPLKGRIVFQVADARPDSQADQGRSRVILSHLGRSIDDAEPKYLFYQGFHKSDALYAQELIWLHEDAADQIHETGSIVLTEGPFDVAKAVESGFCNVVGSFGASPSDAQATSLKAMADAYGAERVRIAFDRDDAGRTGAEKAAQTLRKAGLEADIFNWDAPIGRNRQGDIYLPKSIQDLADFSTEQLQWLRQRRLL